MNQLVPYIIKSTSILLILFVYYKLFLRKQTFFRLNRLYLLGSLLIAIATPFISIEIQTKIFTPETSHPMRVYISNLLDEVYVLANYTSETLPEESGNFNYLLLIYYLGATLFILRYLVSFVQIQRLKQNCQGRRFHGINIFFLPSGRPAFSYFSNLFICPDLAREDRHKIFEHEKIHIHQCHSLDLLIAEIICITNWFNPLVWILKNAIMENHEYIADRQVIRRYHTGSYLELLIGQTLHGAFSFTNYFSCSNLKKRTIMMTKKQSRKYWVLSFIPITAILVTLLYSFSCNKAYTPVSTFVLPDFTKADISEPALDTLGKTADTSSDVFVVVDNMPQFSEGNIQRWLAKNVKYPVEAMEKQIQGKVYIQFIVEKDGQITDVKVIRGADPLLEQEAIRVIQNMPKWKPGTQRGVPVRVSYTLPINFALSGGTPLTADQRYESYLANMDKIIKKIQDPSLLTEQNKAPIGKRLLGDETDDKAAYEKQLKWINSAASPSPANIQHLMDSLNFSKKEQNIVTQAYQKQTQDQTKFIQSLGPDNFIQKFSEIPGFEYSKLLLQAQIALKSDLSPERYKQFIMGTYLKSSPQKDIFVVVEEMPKFLEGTVQNWIATNLKYPDTAKQNHIEGRVIVNFVIEKDGSVSNPKISRGINPELDAEALRLVSQMPKWKPGKQRGQTVRVSYSLPIHFILPAH